MADDAEGLSNAQGGDSAGGGAAVSPPSEPWRPKFNPWLIAVVVALAAFMEVLDTRAPYWCNSIPKTMTWPSLMPRETQLTHMRSGQPVKISVDTYGLSYEGHVLNIGGATGARYSLLPPENATGNYVKVVQRIPVTIVFDKGQDPQHPVRPGMSVEPKVRVK